MLSEFTSSSAFYGLLRMLSQRRRQGILEISQDRCAFKILFHDGRIVGVTRVDHTATREICQRLVYGKRLSKQLLNLVWDVELTTEQLYALLVEKKHVKKRDFLMAKTAYELDLLHSLRGWESGYAEFTPRLVRFVPELALGVHPGQLMLDFAEHDADRERFERVFRGVTSEEINVRALAGAMRGLTEIEALLLAAVQFESTPKQIYRACLLSEFDTAAGLLSLHAQQLIVAEEKADQVFLGGAVLKDQIGALERLKTVMQDSAVGADEGESGRYGPASAKHESDLAKELHCVGQGENVLRSEPEEAAAQGRDEASIPGKGAPPQAEAPQETAQQAVSIDNEYLPQGDSFEQDCALTLVDAPESEVGEEESVCRPGNRFNVLNSRLLQDDAVEKMALYLMLAFLFVLALVLPDSLDVWFKALSDLSSK